MGTESLEKPRSRFFLSVILHLIAILVAVGGIVGIGKLIPTGHEGGWLERFYVSFLLGVTILFNLIFLILSLFNKGKSGVVIMLRVFVFFAPIFMVLWNLIR